MDENECTADDSLPEVPSNREYVFPESDRFELAKTLQFEDDDFPIDIKIPKHLLSPQTQALIGGGLILIGLAVVAGGAVLLTPAAPALIVSLLVTALALKAVAGTLIALGAALGLAGGCLLGKGIKQKYDFDHSRIYSPLKMREGTCPF